MKTKKTRNHSSIVQTLESRCLLSGAVDQIEGTSGNDLFLLQWEGADVVVYRNSIQAENIVYSKSASLLSSLTFNLQGGSDAVYIALNAPDLGSAIRLNVTCDSSESYDYIHFTHPLASTQLNIQPDGATFGSVEVIPANITTYGLISNADSAIELDSLSLGVPLNLAKGNNQVFRLNSISIADAGSLNLNGRSLILNNVSSIQSLNTWIVNGEDYQTPSIVSAFSRSTSTLALLNNTRLHKESFLGQPLLPSFSQTLIRQSLKGDGNLDGVVDYEDCLTVYANMGKHSCEWAHGDFNHDGFVSPADLVVIQKAMSDIVDIPDPNLQAAIRGALKIPSGDITKNDMLKLTVLPAVSMDISDLSGLEYAKNLKKFSAFDNNISDLTPIAGLTELVELYLGQNKIDDLSSLAGLTKLDALLLENNQIVDLSPLTNLQQLTFLDISGNQASDISSLGHTRQLIALFLQSNQITNISSLSGLTDLSILDISGNQISELEPLGNLAFLQVLMVDRNHVSNLSPLSGLTQLESLSASENLIANIGAISNLTNLNRLDLSNNQIILLGSISALNKLEEINLNGNQLTDISSLMTLDSLIVVDLCDNRISNISGILGLTHLFSLNIAYNFIDVSAGSASLALINTLISNGVSVNYLPQSIMPATTFLLNSNAKNDSEKDLQSICLWQYQTTISTNKSLVVSEYNSMAAKNKKGNRAKTEGKKHRKVKKEKKVSVRERGRLSMQWRSA